MKLNTIKQGAVWMGKQAWDFYTNKKLYKALLVGAPLYFGAAYVVTNFEFRPINIYAIGFFVGILIQYWIQKVGREDKS